EAYLRGRFPSCRLAQGRRVLLDVIEQHPHFRHLPAEELMKESNLLCRRQPVIGELADIAAKAGIPIGIDQPGSGRHRAGRERGEQPRAWSTAADFARARMK